MYACLNNDGDGNAVRNAWRLRKLVRARLTGSAAGLVTCPGRDPAGFSPVVRWVESWGSRGVPVREAYGIRTV